MQQANLKKFYVQSGDVNWIVLALDKKNAALRAVQKALQDSLVGKQKIKADMKLVDRGKFEQLTCLFEKQMSISESGFSGAQATLFESRTVIKKWIQQIHSLQNLIRKMAK